MSKVDVLTAGETMLALRASGPLATGVALTASVAGAESNVAIGLSRLGHRAAWVGRVGDDEAGALVLRTLRSEGVDVRATVDAHATGIMIRRERVPGVTTVDYHRRQSAGAALTADDLVLHLGAGQAHWLHVSGVTPALSATACDAVTEAVAAARAGGIGVSLDVNHRTRLWSADAAAQVLAPLARSADVVVASEDELPLVASGPEELLQAGVRIVAVKRGADGAFCAGLLSGLLDDLDPEELLGRAVLLGGFAVSTSGDWEGLPTRSELGLLSMRHGDVRR
jgi:sugar/nucleoside kinase (ribokinase family)